MRSPLVIAKIVLAIVLTLTIGFFPHHHHHGELCLAVDKSEMHHQHENDDEDSCPVDPCDDTSCYLHAMKVFLQAERPSAHHMDFSAVLPIILLFEPQFTYIHLVKTTDICCPTVTAVSSSISRRGPPEC